jgi:hypothetical protein
MSTERVDETRRLDTTAEAPAWAAHLMARYEVVVFPAPAECEEAPAAAPRDHAAVDAIMRYYNG